MIFTDRTITVRKGESRIDEPIVVYRGDYELEVRFTILNSRFKFMSGTNMIESEKASYGQLAILTPYGGNIFSDIVRCNEGSVTFVLTADMLNQIEEVGLYSFQIRLMDYNKESRVSIPPIEFGIEVREPIASEDHDNSVNNAIVGYSIAKVVDPKEENVGDTFDESGNYNKTKWETGDRISEGKLNKIEDAIDTINQNEKNNTTSLSKRIDNNFNILDSTKADFNECVIKGQGTLNDFNEDTRRVILGMETGTINAVLGPQNVTSYNIASNAIISQHLDETIFTSSTGYRLYSTGSGAFENASSIVLHYNVTPATAANITFRCVFNGLSDNIDTVRFKFATGDKASNLKVTDASRCANGQRINLNHTVTYDNIPTDVYIHIWVSSKDITLPIEYSAGWFELLINDKRETNLIKASSYNLNSSIHTYKLTDVVFPALLSSGEDVLELEKQIDELKYELSSISLEDIHEYARYTKQTSTFENSSLGPTAGDYYSNRVEPIDDVYVEYIEMPMKITSTGDKSIKCIVIDSAGLVTERKTFTYSATEADTSLDVVNVKFVSEMLYIPKGGHLIFNSPNSTARMTYNSDGSEGIYTWVMDGISAVIEVRIGGALSYKLYVAERRSVYDHMNSLYVSKDDLDQIEVVSDNVLAYSDSTHDFITGTRRSGVSNMYYAMQYEFEKDICVTRIDMPILATLSGNASFNYHVLDPSSTVFESGVLTTQITQTGTVDGVFDNLNIVIPKGGYLALRYQDTSFKLTYDGTQPGRIRSVVITGDSWVFGQDIPGCLNFKLFYKTTERLTEVLEEYATRDDVTNIMEEVITNTSTNRLSEKKIIAIGDSMVQGHSIAKDKGWLAMIADRNNMTFVNYGINGRYLSNKTYGTYAGVVDSFADMDDDADYIIVFAGTNDAAAGVTIGDDTSTDPSEFKGALNIICDGLLTKYPTKHIMFITPYYRNDKYPAYIEAIESICAKYSIPVFNNAKNGGICWQNSAQVSALTLNDTYHLNLAGMEYASYKYEAFLRTL